MEVIINQDELKMETESIALEEKHNMKNAMAATSVAKLMQEKQRFVKVYLIFKVWNTVLKSIENSKVQYINDRKQQMSTQLLL
jgi:UDP-N-acetylmuramoylalanine--D-glutamate ligase